MLKIGMDKTDKQFRKFEYDDERMFGNPQVFKVLYEETGLFGEVLCSNVISIKKSINTHNHFLNIPKYNESKNIEEETLNQSKEHTLVSTKIVDDVNEIKKSSTEEKKKSKSASKTKSNLLELKETVITEEPEIKISDILTKFDKISDILSKSYEYDILVIDNISDIEDIKNKLNELGQNGWEVCGFQTVTKLFGCQAIIIMKKGLI